MPVLHSFARANTPSQRSIRLWLDSVFLAPLERDGTISANHYEQSNTFDIGVSRFEASTRREFETDSSSC